MTSRLHKCAAEACDKQIAAHLFMCLPHWRMVPKALQRVLRAAWRAYGNALNRVEATADRSDSLRASVRQLAVDAADDLRKAQQQVIHAVREKEIRRALKNQSHGDNLDLPSPDRYAGETPRPD